MVDPVYGFSAYAVVIMNALLTLTLHKSLVQNRFARSISGHQETLVHFQDLHPMSNTLSPLKMAQRPLMASSKAF